jgi:hypothetical protein
MSLMARSANPWFVALGTALTLCVVVAARLLGANPNRAIRHLAQALIPLAGAGLFLGLFALTVGALRFGEVSVPWVSPLRLALLAGAAASSAWLSWRIAGGVCGGRQAHRRRRRDDGVNRPHLVGMEPAVLGLVISRSARCGYARTA